MTLIYFYISESCNLACRHCWIAPRYDPQGKNGIFISLEHVSRAIEQAKPLGLSSVKLTGGEPTLHPHFRELVRLIHNAEISFFMETNGILIDPDLADFLIENGMTFVSVSMDGAAPETHDHLRGVSGSYDAALRGIKALVQAGTRPQVICTLHKDNVNEIEQVVEMAAEAGAGSVKFNLLQKLGRGEPFAANYGIEVPELLDIARWIQNDVEPSYHIRVWVDVPMAFRSLKTLLKRQGLCNIYQILGILATGQLSMCGIGYSEPSLLYGHLDTDNLSDVWKTHPQLQQLRTQIPAELQGICSECIHKIQCKGHCIAYNYHDGQQLNSSYQLCQEASDLNRFPQSRKVV